MSDNDKSSINQRFPGVADSLHEIVRDCQKHDSTTYSYTARVINDVNDKDSGRVVVTARNNQTGKLVMSVSQDVKDVREKGIQLPGLNQLLTADGRGSAL